jgi:hypothetical protein
LNLNPTLSLNPPKFNFNHLKFNPLKFNPLKFNPLKFNLNPESNHLILPNITFSSHPSKNLNRTTLPSLLTLPNNPDHLSNPSNPDHPSDLDNPNSSQYLNIPDRSGHSPSIPDNCSRNLSNNHCSHNSNRNPRILNNDHNNSSIINNNSRQTNLLATRFQLDHQQLSPNHPDVIKQDSLWRRVGSHRNPPISFQIMSHLQKFLKVHEKETDINFLTVI